MAQEFHLDIKAQDKIHVQRDESTRLEFTFSKEEMELSRRAQEALSNKAGGGLKDALLEMAKRTVKAAEPKSTYRNRKDLRLEILSQYQSYTAEIRRWQQRAGKSTCAV